MACGVTEVNCFLKNGAYLAPFIFWGGIVGLCELLGWDYSILRLRIFWAGIIPFCDCEPFELVDVDFGFAFAFAVLAFAVFAFVGFAFLRSECACFESAIRASDECKTGILGTVFGWVYTRISMVWSPYELAFTVAFWTRN